MNDSRIVVKYHSRRMLSTVDLNALFDTLFGAHGDDLVVENLRRWMIRKGPKRPIWSKGFGSFENDSAYSK